MKILFTCSQILLLSILIFAQTTDEIPSPERVLVVYTNPMNGDSTSLKIKNYYVEKRSIPDPINIVPITLSDPVSYGCEFRWNNEEIVDTTLQGDGGWHYVKEVIADIIVE